MKFRKDGNYKGCLVECRREKSTSWEYYYIDYKKPLEEQLNLLDDKVDELMYKYDDILVLKKTYWKVEQYSCVRVYRDKIWFSGALEKMRQCWDKVLFFRKHGIEKIIKLKLPKNFLDLSETELLEYIEKDKLAKKEKLEKQQKKINDTNCNNRNKTGYKTSRTPFNQKCLIEDSDDEDNDDSEKMKNIKKLLKEHYSNKIDKNNNNKKILLKNKTLYLLDSSDSDNDNQNESNNVNNISKNIKKQKISKKIKIPKSKKSKKSKKSSNICLILSSDDEST